MEIRVRRVRRTWPERLLWSRAYEARVLCDGQEIIKRAKTSEDAKALIVNAVQQMTDFGIQIEVRGDLLIVTQPATQFFAVYSKANDRSHLVLKRRTDTDDHGLLAQAWQAANTKARELGWIVVAVDPAPDRASLTNRHST